MTRIAVNSRPAPAHSMHALKCWLSLGLGALVSAPYFFIERHPVFPATLMPLTSLDHATPLVPLAIACYLSFYALLAVPLLLVRCAAQLRQMAFGFAWIAIVSHLCFLLWPTAIPAPVSAGGTSNPLLRLVMAVDTNGNAAPSLHASLAIYCALCSALLLKSHRLRIALWLWTALILASTLLTKRHVFLDLCAGGALGWAAFTALFRARPLESPESVALQATLRARNGVLQGHESEVLPLSRHDWRKRAWEFSFFVPLAAAGACLTARGLAASRWPLLASGIIVTALALNAFVLLMHEGMHSTLFRIPLWNRMVSVLLGSTFLMSFSAYRVLHTRHHNFLGDPRDPDDYQNYTKRRALLWFLHFVRLVAGPLLYLALIPILALKYGSDKERRAVLVEYGFLMAVYSLALRFMPASFLLAGWLAPLLIVGILTAIRGFTQHGITDVEDPYIASRTILPHPVVGFFLLHENYHLEHHLFPEVPSYHLTRLHYFVWPRLPRVVSGRSYLGFIAGFLRATPRLDDTPIGLETPGKRSS